LGICQQFTTGYLRCGAIRVLSNSHDRLEPRRPSQENLLSGFAPGIGVRLRIKESWLAGFEEGRKYPLKESK